AGLTGCSAGAEGCGRGGTGPGRGPGRTNDGDDGWTGAAGCDGADGWAGALGCDGLGCDGADGAAAGGALCCGAGAGAAGAADAAAGSGRRPRVVGLAAPFAPLAIDSRSFRATGASTVDDGDFTYSPMSWSLLSTCLLVTPSSFASSCTRALPATALLLPGGRAAFPLDLEPTVATRSWCDLHSWLMTGRPDSRDPGARRSRTSFRAEGDVVT